MATKPYSEPLGRTPTLSEFVMLKPFDRLIVDLDGERRIAKVAHRARRDGDRILRVWLHRKGRVGFCSGQTTVRRQQVVDVTHCAHFNIAAAEKEQLLIGGAA